MARFTDHQRASGAQKAQEDYEALKAMRDDEGTTCACGHGYYRHWYTPWQGEHGCWDCDECDGFKRPSV